jgi:hypothetical protein
LLDDLLIALLKLPGWSGPADAVLWSDISAALSEELFAFTPHRRSPVRLKICRGCKRSPVNRERPAADPVLPVP